MKANPSLGGNQAIVAKLADRAEQLRSSMHEDASNHDLAMVAVMEDFNEINSQSSKIYASVVAELFQREKFTEFQSRGGSFLSRSHAAQAAAEEANERNFAH